MSKIWYIYIMTNKKWWTLYIWVSSNLPQRIYQHKEWLIEWFTKNYWLKNLVYYEECSTIENAIIREKQLNWGSGKQKIDLIELNNKEWEDLYHQITD